ncbi:MAG: RdgB/HAM1 family non-canonical purine NTP pyrophosphatase, partial [Oscillospiraceae bacterium]
IMEATNLPTIADDSGLCVDYLGGEPGIYTARYAGENASDSDNIKKLLCELEGVPPQDRNAKFVCVMAVAIPCKKIQIFRGECSGRITDEKMGESGFGYDPIFYAVQYGKTMAELEPHIKNAISHRSKACNRMAESLKKY